MLMHRECRAFGGPPMPFTLGFQIYPWIERILRVRQYPLTAYGLALILVALAVLVRGLVGQFAGVQVVFTTFYPAIIIATLIGGLWPGISQLSCLWLRRGTWLSRSFLLGR
jgi:hypothetical protein